MTKSPSMCSSFVADFQGMYAFVVVGTIEKKEIESL